MSKFIKVVGINGNEYHINKNHIIYICNYKHPRMNREAAIYIVNQDSPIHISLSEYNKINRINELEGEKE